MNILIVIKGKQYNIIEKETLRIDKINCIEGQKMILFNAIRFDKNKINNVKVEAIITRRLEKCKLVTLKNKRRKNYQRKLGDNRTHTFIRIEKAD